MGEFIVLENEEKQFQKNATHVSSAPSGTTQFKFMIAGKALRVLRTYWLHVPPSYDGSHAVPLVIVLHMYTWFGEKQYWNQSGGLFWFFRSCLQDNISEFCKKADEKGFIVVYPNGKFIVPRRGWDWNFAWIPILPTFSKYVDDVGYLRALIDKMKQDYNINLSRIYVSGFSDGACMTYSIGAYLSDEIAAIAPVAGIIGGRVHKNDTWSYIPTPANPVSVIIFHGTNDSQFSYEGDWGDTSVNESVSYWVEHNGCNPIPEINTSVSGKIIRRTYTNGKNGTEVVLYTTVGGEHWWPGNHFNDPLKEISATDLIWEFFESHPKQ
jgi:polyhydroxybutyrate depolymerase